MSRSDQVRDSSLEGRPLRPRREDVPVGLPVVRHVYGAGLTDVFFLFVLGVWRLVGCGGIEELWVCADQ